MLILDVLCVNRDGYAPTELNIFVDAGCDAHGDDGVVPRADEHERQAQAHTQERQSPVGDRKSHVCTKGQFLLVSSYSKCSPLCMFIFMLPSYQW